MTDTKPVAAASGNPDPKDHTIAHRDPLAQRVWDHVSHSPLHSLWNFEGTSPWVVLKRTAKSFMDDNLLSRAAELGYYFLFALFPTLVSASSILGLAARGATKIYVNLLNYQAMVVPHSAYQLVIETFNQTTQASSGGKITLGLAAALWSASVGFSAIQDTLNTVYKVKETRPYWKARGSAILVTVLLSAIVTSNLAILLLGDFMARYAAAHIWHNYLRIPAVVGLRVVAWGVACALLMLLFSTIYYFAPDLKNKRWHWLTPGAAIGILTWMLASLALRIYLHFFDSYSVTYGSLGAVIILLTWFYITGLTLLAGAEINSEIQAAIVEKRLKEAGQLPPEATTDPEHPVPAATPPQMTPQPVRKAS
ncbi:MAG TPA: YihY/virulence factor BrkB family protein [Acidobacteriaceae bacterium]|nr:YihY/virulence factor BrkB family protein [Acidobacteriaceae bacterium]